MVRIRKNRINLVILSALMALVILLASAAIAPAIANGVGLLWLNPASTAIDKGATTEVVVQLDSVTNVYGAQFSLSFDPAVLQVVDADSGTGGVQISTGTCPNPAFVIANTADNGAGTVGYAAIQLGPSPPPCDGGDVASIEFQCIASGVSSDVTFTDSLISDPDGIPVAHTTLNGSVSCNHAIYLPLVLNSSSP
jgi:hypothetical protein